MSNESEPSGLEKPCSKVERYHRKLVDTALWRFDTAELLEAYSFCRVLYEYYMAGYKNISDEEALMCYDVTQQLFVELDERGMEWHWPNKEIKKRIYSEE